MPKNRTRGLFVEMEQFELAAELAMIALFGFLEPVQISLQLFLVRPGGAVMRCSISLFESPRQ